MARPVDFEATQDTVLLPRAIKELRALLTTREYANTVCLGCPAVGIGLQCLVWADGTARANPEIVSRHSEQTAGAVTHFVVARYGGVEGLQEVWLKASLQGDKAACLETMLDLFGGVMAKKREEFVKQQ